MISNFIKNNSYLLYEIAKDFYKKEGFARSHSLANTIVLSFVPFLVALASITTFVLSKDSYNKLEKFILRNNLPFIGEKIANYMQLFHQNAKGLSLFSFISFFIISILMIGNLNNHLTKIYGREQSNVSLTLRVINFGTVALGAILLGISVIIPYYLTLVAKFNNSIPLAYMTITLTITAFSLIYKFVSFGQIKFKRALIAGIVAGILFEIAKFFFTIYIKYFATEQIIYGSLAIVPLFLLWIYISCLILLGCGCLISDKKKPN